MVDARRRRAPAEANRSAAGALPTSNIRAIGEFADGAQKAALNLQAPEIPRPPRLPILPDESGVVEAAPVATGVSPLVGVVVTVVVAAALGYGTWRLLHP